MADIYLDTLTYYKDEIDSMRAQDTTDRDNLLDDKMNANLLGVPGGVSQLDSSGEVPYIQLPIATYTEAVDKLNGSTIITPETLHVVQETNTVYKTEKGVALGVPTLDANGKIPLTQIPDQGSVNTYYVPTIADMLALTNIGEGDRCVVHSDPNGTNNGEYVATVSNPADITEWGKIPASNDVLSVNGDVGTVTVDRSNTPQLDTVITNTLDNSNRITINVSDIATNASDISTLQATVAPLDADVTEHERQLNLDTSNLGTHINTMLTSGDYEVDTGLPNGSTLGRLKIVYDTNLTSRVIQTFTDSDTKQVSNRQHNGTAWSAWSDDTMQLAGLSDVAVNPPLGNAPLRWNGYQYVADSRDLSAQYITLNNGNIIYPEFADGSAEGQYVIMKANGHFGLKVVPDADHVQKDQRSGEGGIEAPLTFIQLHSIIADVEYLATDSSLSLDFTVDNVSGTDRTLTIEFRVNGIATTTQDFTVWGNVVGQNIEMSSKFLTNRVIGDIFTVHIKASKEANVFVKTDVDISELRVTKSVSSTIARVKVLEDKNVYEFSKASGLSTTINTWQIMNALLIPNAAAGVYEYKMSLTFNYSTTLRSAYFRFSLDNGVSWNEFRVDGKGSTDNKPLLYSFPKIHNGGVMYLATEYRCENNGDILNVPFSDVIIERKA